MQLFFPGPKIYYVSDVTPYMFQFQELLVEILLGAPSLFVIYV